MPLLFKNKNTMFEFNNGEYGSKELLDNHNSSYMWGENKRWVTMQWDPKIIFPQLEKLRESFKDTNEVAIAGGAVLGCWKAKQFDDIDIFPLTTTGKEQAQLILKAENYYEEKKAKYCIYYGHRDSSNRKVQLILLHTDTKRCSSLLSRFDLSICQVALLAGKLYTNNITIKDIKNELIRVTGTLNVNNMLARIEKYKSRGFKTI